MAPSEPLAAFESGPWCLCLCPLPSEPRSPIGVAGETVRHLLLLSQRWQTLVAGCPPSPPHRTGCSGGQELGLLSGRPGAREGVPLGPRKKPEAQDQVFLLPTPGLSSDRGGASSSSSPTRWGWGARPHRPPVGVPGDEPPGEGGRLMALLDQNGGCGQASLGGMSPQVLKAPGCHFLL